MKKIFGTDGVRCIVNTEPMTSETCLKIAKTTGYLMSIKIKGKKRVVISKDTRLSGYLTGRQTKLCHLCHLAVGQFAFLGGASSRAPCGFDW